ncbi:MAG: hypothetical protein Fur0022_36620 [Anaerolineales bacterium]
MSRRIPFLLLLLFLVFAALLRLTDLHDEPLDFNPVRQLRSALIARGLYYAGLTEIDPNQQRLAVNYGGSMPLYEPPLLENLVAFGYRLAGEENIAVPRLLNTFFWLISAGLLFFLGREMASAWAILPGLAFFLFLPFSIYASRSFQPEALMVMWTVLTFFALARWAKTPCWKWALLVGLCGGVAALVKVMAAFFLGPAALAAVLWQGNRSPIENFTAALRNPQVWAMGLLMVLPSAWYYLFTIPQSSAEYLNAWTIFGEFSAILSPSFYMRWMLLLNSNFGLTVIFLGLLGALIAPPATRNLLLALWLGYFLHGLAFPRQTPTHDYYHIMLLPITALSLAPLTHLLAEPLQKPWWVRTASVMMLLLGSFYGGWIARSVLVGKSYADAPRYWQEISAILPEGRTVGYTQDFSLPMMYYGWRRIFPLPQKLTPEKFAADPEEAEYFIITDFEQAPAALADYIAQTYPLLAKGDGYAIYDLKP